MSRIRKAPAGILGFPVAPFNTQGKLEEEALFKTLNFAGRRLGSDFYRLRVW